MVEGDAAAHYAAFISYSHRDAAAARALHRRLESYRIPRRLVGGRGDHGPVPARLTPIFRDRDELPAAGDLSETVRAALAASDALIVLCSPHAAASPWVAREIEAFRELNPGRPVLAAIIAGEPAACFPAALRAAAGGIAVEPLAADLRRAGDGRRLGFLKLVAGLIGIGLDPLVQRDAARQIRRVTAVTLLALAATLVMAVLTIFAIDARREAERQRGAAEGLVEFMLTDLRTKLKGVGRLDVLTTVNARALAYYGQQSALDRLPDESLERRARVLQAMGEDDEARGEFAAASTKFGEAHRTTAALLKRAPDMPERIFAHSQSEFWLGDVAYRRKNLAAARAAFLRYKALTERLLAIAPDQIDWIREAGFADGSLCALAFEPPVDRASALRHCLAGLERMQAAARASAQRGPGDLPRDLPRDLDALISRHAWAARAWQVNGQPDKAIDSFRAQVRLAQRLTDLDPANRDYRDQWVRAHLAMGEALLEQGKGEAARSFLTQAMAAIAELRRLDPANARWRSLEAHIRRLTL